MRTLWTTIAAASAALTVLGKREGSGGRMETWGGRGQHPMHRCKCLPRGLRTVELTKRERRGVCPPPGTLLDRKCAGGGKGVRPTGRQGQGQPSGGDRLSPCKQELLAWCLPPARGAGEQQQQQQVTHQTTAVGSVEGDSGASTKWGALTKRGGAACLQVSV